MNLIQRFHEFVTKLGVSPKVADAFVGGLIVVGVNWAISGSFDLGEVKLLIAAFVMSAFGVAAPIVTGKAANGRTVSVGTRDVIEGTAQEIHTRKRRR